MAQTAAGTGMSSADRLVAMPHIFKDGMDASFNRLGFAEL
jgi:hypothetical protein